MVLQIYERQFLLTSMASVKDFNGERISYFFYKYESVSDKYRFTGSKI